ncbi:MAG: dihydroorotase [Desulfobacteraceae bacterium]|jgi:dihydroorotase|nr:dihydroorotase [Desulfobacteraceae bacterium]
MRLIIKNGHIIDPGNIDTVTSIIIDDGIITHIAESAAVFSEKDKQDIQIIDAAGCFVVPGLIDMHVHLRDPGHEYKESIETGIRAAAAGGFTAVCCMPNTRPVNDNRQITDYIIKTADQLQSVAVYPVASISRGLKGHELSDFGELKESGAVAVSDDGLTVSESQLMRRALEYAKGVGLKVISHCEDAGLSDGDMNEGLMSTRMGLAGIPNAAESIMVMRDIALCELTGSPVHIAHVSTKESVHAIRDAKLRGALVTAETAPHYFTLTDEAVGNYDTNAKMNPPLRSREDREAIRKGLADGTIDVIVTDHAPHSVLEKEVEFEKAANGIIGLETSLPLGLKLVAEGAITLEMLIEKMSKNPSEIIGLSRNIAVNEPANLTIIDTERSFTYDVEKGFSKSKNSPFNGWQFKGMAVYTIVNGRVVFENK